MSALVELRRGAYVDSVSLMQVSRRVAELPGVDAALVAMATELNGDLLVAVRAADDAAMSEARLTVDAALAELSRPVAATGPGAVEPPRTVRVAAARSGATLALVSVPGPHAFTEAMDALEAGLSVMVFSDNVPLDQEIRLKEEGDRRGLLVMGPDCGTAIVGGVGLGFANAVRGGPVGVVAASGTGAQQLTCLLDAAAVGVSHVLGVGGRDLSAAVGGRSTLPALAALDEDPGTELIVVVSKPPAVEVAERVAAAADGLRTRVVLAFLGRDREDLSAVAAEACADCDAGVAASAVPSLRSTTSS